MALSKEARELRNAYQRQWMRKNPEKIRQYVSNYWERKAKQFTPELKARELQGKGYTQRQIAEQLGVSLGTVNSYLNKP